MAQAAAARRVPKAGMDPKRESCHLWLCLLALGFNPKCHRGVRLGRSVLERAGGGRRRGGPSGAPGFTGSARRERLAVAAEGPGVPGDM